MTTRHPNLQRFLDGMAAKIGDETAEMLLEASGPKHPYHCKCALCLEFWAAVGPEHSEGTPTWGPFTAKEIKEYKTNVHN